LPCIFIGYSTKHKGYLCFHVASSHTYIARHVVFDESYFPFLDHNSQESAATITISPLPLQTLQEALMVGLLGRPSPPSTPSLNRRPYPNAPAYFRPSATSEHRMVTGASTSYFKPKIFVATKYPLLSEKCEIEPRTFHQAIKNSNWQHAMQLEFDGLIFNRTWYGCATGLVRWTGIFEKLGIGYRIGPTYTNLV
ncbi:hypothetical protein V2J09_008621, partial [Rumex salicifolius]